MPLKLNEYRARVRLVRNVTGLFAYFYLMVPTFGLALEKSRSQESEALRNRF